ncbi:MAG: radical SAM family heme chaperone HemW [Sinobacteraceae bacterium]|nr:radical SAM family heme chaperone HemW [Nevskiaceae bacterium]MCP5470633.1 radical SAM family heme chaperone HemW [Nevskiaceae bacterium]
MTQTAGLPPLALYVHFPWCVSKCPYCDFNSHAVRETLPEARYIAALLADLEAEIAADARLAAGSREVVSVFLGGGTPSLFSPEAIATLLEGARRRLPFAADVEVTLEANPGTIERGRFAGYAAAGINRVSLGAQSFDAAALRRLGRIHDPDDTRRAAQELHAAGLANFNLDLMYALPGQSVAQALADIEQALALQPAHLSHYHLTLEAGTPFAARPPADLPPDDTVESMLEAALARLDAAGFVRYEISAWARSGRRCRHNLNYWRFGDYLGIGAGAHGKLSSFDAATGGGALQIQRSLRLREPRRYLSQQPAAVTRTAVTPAQRPFEFMLNALRLVEGVETGLYERRVGSGLEELAPSLRRLTERGLLVDPATGRLGATAAGLRFLNDLLVEFLPEETGT